MPRKLRGWLRDVNGRAKLQRVSGDVAYTAVRVRLTETCGIDPAPKLNIHN
jgi:hypothetical protein